MLSYNYYYYCARVFCAYFILRYIVLPALFRTQEQSHDIVILREIACASLCCTLSAQFGSIGPYLLVLYDSHHAVVFAVDLFFSFTLCLFQDFLALFHTL